MTIKEEVLLSYIQTGIMGLVLGSFIAGNFEHTIFLLVLFGLVMSLKDFATTNREYD